MPSSAPTTPPTDSVPRNVLSSERLQAAAFRLGLEPVQAPNDDKLILAVQSELAAWAFLLAGERERAVATWQAALEAYGQSASPLARQQAALLGSEVIGPASPAPAPPAALCQRLGLPAPADPAWARAWLEGFAEPAVPAEPVPAAEPDGVEVAEPTSPAATNAEALPAKDDSQNAATSEGPPVEEVAPEPAPASAPAVAESPEPAPPPAEEVAAEPSRPTLGRDIACVLPDGRQETVFARGTELPAETALTVKARKPLVTGGPPLALLLVEPSGAEPTGDGPRIIGRLVIAITVEGGRVSVSEPITIELRLGADEALEASAHAGGHLRSSFSVTVESAANPPEAATLAAELERLREWYRRLGAFSRQPTAGNGTVQPTSQRHGKGATGEPLPLDPTIAVARRKVRELLAAEPTDRIAAGSTAPADRGSGLVFLLELEQALDLFEQALDRAGVDRSKPMPAPPFPILEPERLAFLAGWFAGDTALPALPSPKPAQPKPAAEAAPVAKPTSAGLIFKRKPAAAGPAAPPPRQLRDDGGAPPPPPPPPRRRPFLRLAVLAAVILILMVLSPRFLDEQSFIDSMTEIFQTLRQESANQEPRATDDAVLSIAFSPDGRRFVTSTRFGLLSLWNADKLERYIERRYGGKVVALAFSPDGSKIATGYLDGTVRLWSANLAGSSIVLGTHSNRVLDIAFNPEGSLVATAAIDGTARVWATDNRRSPIVLRDDKGDIRSIAFDHSGRRLVTTSQFGTVRVWQLDRDGALPLVDLSHPTDPRLAAFSPDGSRIVTITAGSVARAWRADGRGEPLVATGPKGPIVAAALSPLGGLLATATDDGGVQVWPIDSPGEPVVLQRQGARVNALAFRPDGLEVATASADGTVRLWPVEDIEDRAMPALPALPVLPEPKEEPSEQPAEALRDQQAKIPLDEVEPGAGGDSPSTAVYEVAVSREHSSDVHDAAISPGGDLVVSALGSGVAELWGVNGTGSAVTLRGHTMDVLAAAFSSDGKYIVTGSIDRTARVWRVDGEGEPIVLRGHISGVVGTAFSPDDNQVVTASLDGMAQVWRADGMGEPVFLRGHEKGVTSAAFSPDGAYIVTSSGDGTARSWRVDGTGEPIVLRGHEGSVSSAAFSPDGHQLVTASFDDTVRLWSTDGKEIRTFQGHTGSVADATFSPDGRWIVSASYDGTARVWPSDGDGAAIVLEHHGNAVRSATFGPDATTIVTTALDGRTRVWRAREDAPGLAEILPPVEAPTPADELTAVEPAVVGVPAQPAAAVLDLGAVRILTALRDGTALLWAANRPAPLATFRGHDDWVVAAAMSPDGRRLVTASLDGTARIWPVGGGASESVLRGHSDAVTDVGFSPDGERIVTASSDGTAWVWPARGPAVVELVLQGHRQIVWSAAFSPDGGRIVTAGADGTARVWSARTGAELLVLRGHQGSVYHAAFSPDGRHVATASLDGTARIWSTANGGDPIVLRGHQKAVHRVTFSPEGERIVTTSADGTTRLWPAAGDGGRLVLSGHAEPVDLANFAPDGRILVTASRSRAVAWGTSEKHPTQTLPELRGRIQAVLFSPDASTQPGDANRLVATDPGPSTALEQAPSSEPSRDPFAKEEDAHAVQEALAVAGFYDGRIDGIFGRNSRRALQRWKEANGLTPDTAWDLATEQRMFEP